MTGMLLVVKNQLLSTLAIMLAMKRQKKTYIGRGTVGYSTLSLKF